MTEETTLPPVRKPSALRRAWDAYYPILLAAGAGILVGWLLPKVLGS